MRGGDTSNVARVLGGEHLLSVLGALVLVREAADVDGPVERLPEGVLYFVLGGSHL